jgi:hypothetical protein
MELELTPEAVALVDHHGGTVALDFIRAVG